MGITHLELLVGFGNDERHGVGLSVRKSVIVHPSTSAAKIVHPAQIPSFSSVQAREFVDMADGQRLDMKDGAHLDVPSRILRGRWSDNLSFSLGIGICRCCPSDLIDCDYLAAPSGDCVLSFNLRGREKRSL